MPSLLAEDPAPAIASLLPHDKRTSFDRQSQAADRIEGSHQGHVVERPNGVLPNGSTIFPLPNGQAAETGSLTSRESLVLPHPPGDKCRRSSAVEPDKGQQNHGRRGDSRLATKDDGYFATSKVAQIETGFLETHVKLGAVNNNPQQDSKGEDETSVPQEDKILQDGAIYTEPGKLSPGDKPVESPADGSHRVLHQANRMSSPAALQKESSNPLTHYPSNRIQQRHNLEVPRSTNRLSREGPNRTEVAEVVTASGRVTPSTPTRRRGSMTLVRRATRSLHSDMHLDDVPQDEDAARWTEMVRQKRMSKRKRKEEEEEDTVVMGTKVDQNHVNYVTAYNMLTGIRFTVSRTNAKLDRDLTDADFEARHKFSFDVTGNELTPSAKYDFKFKDYAPWVFRHLRSIFRLDPADYLMSLTAKYIVSELGSPGKSGSFFYFSRDYKYIIKTIHHQEHKFLRKILKDYFNHIKQNPNTLLSQFYGLHRVKIPYGRKIHFIVMNNLFPPHRDIHRTFDLKGSTYKRDFKEEDLQQNPRATLKDLNWIRRGLHLEFGPTKKNMFIEQLQKDVAFLQRLKVMDYSLLVGIHDLERGNEDNLRDKTLQVFQPGGESVEDLQQSLALIRTPSKLETARKAKELRHTLRTEKPVPMGQTLNKMPDEMGSERKGFYFYQDDGGFRASHEDDSPGEEIYYLGIIDCLTHYGCFKWLESFVKSIGNRDEEISAVPPDYYGDRFIRFIKANTKTREAAEKEARTTHSIEDPHLSGSHQHRNPAEDLMEKAEKSAERSGRHGINESNVPDRSLTTEHSPPTDRNEPGGFILPIVEEAAENQSTGGRSGRSREASASPHLRLGDHDLENSGSKPPPTPPKDVGDVRPRSSERQASHGGQKPPTPPRYGKGNVHLDKDLPLPPLMSPTQQTHQEVA